MSRVIVTGAGGKAGHGLATVLNAYGHTVIGVDMAPPAASPIPTLHVPPASDPVFPIALFDVALSWRADLIVPTVTEELELPALHAPPLGQHVVIAPFAATSAAGDKWLTYAILSYAGIAVPRSSLPHAEFEVGDGEPWLTKPRKGRGARGVFVHRVPRDHVQVEPGNVVQEYVDGSEFAVELFVPPAGGQGEAAIVFEKLELANGEVGNATAVRRVPPEESGAISSIALRAAHALGLTGPADVDVRLRSDGTPVVLEVNARVGAHIAAAPEIASAIVPSYLAQVATVP